MSTMTLLTAHSGSDELPENSIKFASFFRNKPAVDAIEVDVRYDDLEHKLVLHHEPLEKDRLYTSLASIFKCIKNSHLLINCDLKETGLEDEVFWLADQIENLMAFYVSHADCLGRYKII